MDERRLPFARAAAAYARVGLLSLLGVCVVVRADKLKYGSPIHYTGDGTQGLVLIENMIETGWFSTNERFGACGGMDLHEFPMPDLLHFGFLWLIAQAVPDPPVVYEAYYFFASVLGGMSMLWLLRGLHIRFVPAVTASVIFACLPFHFTRLAHLFFASYWTIPFGAFLVIRTG